MKLPDFPWDRLAPLGQRAREHARFADLSIGSPVDPTPWPVQQALAAAAQAPGYPTVAGLPQTSAAFTRWLTRRVGVTADVSMIPSIGSKEVVALLPILLGLREGDRVVVPELAYPTYVVGALFAHCDIVVSDDPAEVSGARLVWLNSPSNPTGRVSSVDELRDMVAASRATGAIVASDECYIEFGWDADPVSILDPRVIGDDPTGVVALHALSKRSNMAGYRYGAIAGDPDVIAGLLEVRKHLGFMVPLPVQHAATVAWDDDDHVVEQRARYAARRSIMAPALLSAGFRIDHSEAGLYLWASRGEECWDTAAWFADRGVLVAPGDFYGAAGREHVRIALTATDATIEAAAASVSA